MLERLELIKPVSWGEVFNVWQINEGQDSVWQKFAVKEKGWKSWSEWRSYQASQIKASERDWALYEITTPNQLIPEFVMGPFGGWQKHYPEEERNVHTFADLVKDQTDWVKNNIGVKSRQENFPQGTQFIGIFFPEEDNIVLFEGHHRAAAVALAHYQNKPINFQIKPVIALTTFRPEERHFITELLKNGSHNPQKEAYGFLF